MELVLLADMQNSFGSNWARIANTEGVDKIQIGDRFREQGYGPGAEELEVSGVDISPVGGFSRLYFVRAANATQPEVHRLGAVLLPVEIKTKADITDVLMDNLGITPNMAEGYKIELEQRVAATSANVSSATAVTNQPTNGSASADAQVVPASSDPSAEETTESLVALKRGRGRPPGSRNKAKPTAKAQEAEFPTGF